MRSSLALTLLFAISIVVVGADKRTHLCGRHLARRLINLCGLCYGKASEDIATFGCALPMTDAERVEKCCPDGRYEERQEYLEAFETPKEPEPIRQAPVRSCGRKLAERIDRLCPNKCTGKGQFVTMACAVGITDKDLIENCCPTV